MHTSGSATGASKKRKLSSSAEENPQPKERTSEIVRRSIALLTAIPDLPNASFGPLLDTLNEAYQSALVDEADPPKLLPQQLEDWNWELSPEQIARLSEEDLTIWKDMLVCRPSFRVSGIKVHPFNWHMPIVDMKQWEAHIPGVQGVVFDRKKNLSISLLNRLQTPWEGGVYTLQLIFWHGIPEGVPIFRFIRPLFHLHTYPTGTWAREEYDVVEGISRHAVWKKTKLEDPERLVTLLRRIQKQLNEPDTKNPHQYDAYILMKDDPAAYEKKIREQAEDWKPDPQTGLAGRRILQPVLQD